EVLVLQTPDGGRERIWLDAKDRQWDVVEAERRDGHGHVLWHLSHSGFATQDGVRLPARTEVEEPPSHSQVRIKFRDLEPNVHPPEEPFQLAPPPNVPSELADC